MKNIVGEKAFSAVGAGWFEAVVNMGDELLPQFVVKRRKTGKSPDQP